MVIEFSLANFFQYNIRMHSFMVTMVERGNFLLLKLKEKQKNIERIVVSISNERKKERTQKVM